MASDNGATSQEDPKESPSEKAQDSPQDSIQETSIEQPHEKKSAKKKSRLDNLFYQRNLRKLEKLRQETARETITQIPQEPEQTVEVSTQIIDTQPEIPIQENQPAIEETQPAEEEPQIATEVSQEPTKEAILEPKPEDSLPTPEVTQQATEGTIITEILQVPKETGQTQIAPQPNVKKSGRLSGLFAKLKLQRAPKATQQTTQTVQNSEGSQQLEEVPQPIAEVSVQVETTKPEEAPVETIQQQVAQANAAEAVESISKYADDLKAKLPTKAIICVGEYPIHLMFNRKVPIKQEGVLPLFIDKSSADILKWSQAQLDPKYIIGLDSDLDTHFWFNIAASVTGSDSFTERLKKQPMEKVKEALFVASVWDGVGSGLLPFLISQLNEWKISSVALTIVPSKLQPLESQFNTLCSVGTSITKNASTLVIVDRDNLESYIGVDRNGQMIRGNDIANYLLDIMLSKETLVGELSEISKTFDSKLFTLLFASGASLKIYGSIGNMLDTALFKPMLTFNISTTTLLYVVVRMPFYLKEKLSRAKIEMAVASYFKDKAALQSIYVSEPIYVEDASDRIDIALFAGGFETAKMFSTIKKKVESMKDQAVKKGALKEEDWQVIVKNLTE